MAHIREMTDKRRTLPWRAQVHRKGHKPLVKMFLTKRDAERWATEQERNITLAGLPLTFAELKHHTVGELVERYLREKTPLKGCAVSETTVLRKFIRRDICSLSLAAIKKFDAYKYVSDRLKETWRAKPITPRTVRRELNTIAHIFEVAREEWGFENLDNPFRVKLKGTTYRRKRRLNEGELEKLEQACELCRGTNRYYVSLAIYLAIETGMRLQEIFNLSWQDVAIDDRRIEISKSKTDHVSDYAGRTIVMTLMANWYFTRLASFLTDGKSRRLWKDAATRRSRIFPMTKEAFKQSWADVLKRAGIGDLTFHDLRREAGTRFDAAGLTKPERDLMLGHANRDMDSLYVSADLKVIQDKLDRYELGGLTMKEATEKSRANATINPDGSKTRIPILPDRLQKEILKDMERVKRGYRLVLPRMFADD